MAARNAGGVVSFTAQKLSLGIMWIDNHVLNVVLVHVGLIGTTQMVVGGLQKKFDFSILV